MGCASSNPLVEGGKNLVDNAKETKDVVMARGGKAMHDAGEAVATSVDHVKSTVESGLQTAQQGIGNAMNSIESSMGMAKAKVEDKVEEADTAVEDLTKSSTDAIDEAISDTKTVLAFEDATNYLAEQEDALKHEFGETVNQIDGTMEETLHIEDMEQTIDQVLDTPVKKESPKKEAKAEEEPPLTPWEAAADEILEKSFSKCSSGTSQQLDDSDVEHESGQPPLTEVSKDNFDSKEYSDILISDTLSMKSYKSEI